MLPGIAPADRIWFWVRRGVIASVILACVALAVPVNPAGAEGSTLNPAVGGAARSASAAPGRIGVEDRAAVEEDLAWLVNQRRLKAGLRPLLLAPQVIPAAREWAQHQATAGGISHRADLSPYPDSVPGLPWALTGENVGHSGSAQVLGPAVMTALDQAFYDSPKHRDNVLGPYSHLAVGVVDDGVDLYVTVAFVDWGGAGVTGERLPESTLHDTGSALDRVEAVEGGVQITGWVSDPDGDPSMRASIRGDATKLQPNVVRSDLVSVVGARPDLKNGVDQVVPAHPGPASVCVDAPPVGFGKGTGLGCRDVVVPQGWDGLIGPQASAKAVSFAATGPLPGRADGVDPTAAATSTTTTTTLTTTPVTVTSRTTTSITTTTTTVATAPTSAAPSTSVPATGSSVPPRGAIESTWWLGRSPATLQHYPNDGHASAPFLVHADPFGRLHWSMPDGTAVVARPPGGAVAPGTLPVDLGDVDGDGDDDLVVLVRSGDGWAATGFENADPSKPLPVVKLPQADDLWEVQAAVLPDPGGKGASKPRGGEILVERLAVTGRTADSSQVWASLRGAAAIPLGVSVPRSLVVDVEWLDADGDGVPDVVVSSPGGSAGTTRVQLFTAAGLYQRVDDTVTRSGSPIDLEPR